MQMAKKHQISNIAVADGAYVPMPIKQLSEIAAKHMPSVWFVSGYDVS